ncbi:MAG: glycosyltransferase family 2 protein [Bacteroidetes bacterium]|nr:glycosyltransferase family 2 protein [Bacteroidota bacterium]
MDISIIIPLYNEEDSLPELYDWIVRIMQAHDFSYEIIFVDDGSNDNSWEKIKGFCKNNNFIKGIKFRRNYGKSAALNCGFEVSEGDVVITMDADLQDSPDEIPGLYKMIRDDDYDLVSGWKKKRHDPLTKTIPSKFFNWITRIMSGVKLHDFNCGLKAYRKEVIKSIDIYGEMHRYIPVIAKWSGFTRIGEKVVQHQARKYGVTKFGIERFIFGFLDLLSITFVSKFKKRPMHFFGTIGAFSFLVGLIITLWIIGDKIYQSYYGLMVRDVVDQPLFFLALLSMIIGTLLFIAGFLAEMIAISTHKKGAYPVSEKIGKFADEEI